jgi:hypothetical protein
MRISSDTARRPSYFDADSKLQELVEAEFDVILKAAPTQARAQKPAAASRPVEQAAIEEDRPLPDSLALPFAPEEESFIASSIAFLRGRANADLLLEELWSATVSGEGTEETATSPEETTEKPSAETPNGDKPGEQSDV